MPAAYQHFRTRLQIEQTRLLNWGEKLGLVEELLDHPSQTLQLNRNLIIDILLEIQASFKSCVKVTSKYDRHVRAQEISTIPIVNGAKNSFLERTLARFDSPAKLSARLQWALIKQDQFEKLIEQLIELNDRIEGFLDRNTLEDLRLMQQKSNLMLLQLTAQISQLQILAGALQLPGKSGVNVRPGLSRSFTLEGSANADADQALLASLASFKALELSSEIATDAAEMMLVSREDLSITSVPISGSRILTTFHNQPVWVEWRDSIGYSRPQTELDMIIQDRVAKLAALLGSSMKPSAFRAPKCLGYFRDEKGDDEPRYGLIYEPPNPSVTDLRTMTSLRDLLDSTPPPSLNKRVALACVLSESLLYLHAVNWLHKGVRSESVLFFPEGKNGSTDGALLSDLVLAGFDCARPDLLEELTIRNPSNVQQDMYRHPSLLQHNSGTTYQKSYDIYSLGIVLTEIALWSPVENIAKIPLGTKAARSRVLGIRETLLSSTIEASLCERVGENYTHAVLACLKGGEAVGVMAGADEGQPGTGARMQQVFFEDILARLRNIKL